MDSGQSDFPCMEGTLSREEGHSGCSGVLPAQVASAQSMEVALQEGPLDAIVQRVVVKLQASRPSGAAQLATAGKKTQAKGLKRKARPPSSSDSEDSQGPNLPKKAKKEVGQVF